MSKPIKRILLIIKQILIAIIEILLEKHDADEKNSYAEHRDNFAMNISQ